MVRNWGKRHLGTEKSLCFKHSVPPCLCGELLFSQGPDPLSDVEPDGELRCERHESTIRTGDASEELGLFTVRDGNVEVEKRADAFQFGAAGSGEFEAEEFAAGGRVGGRVDGVGAPLDEEGEKASLIVVKIESLPLEKAAIGTFARARRGTVEGEVGVAKTSREGVEVAGMRGPAGEARRGEFFQTIPVG